MNNNNCHNNCDCISCLVQPKIWSKLGTKIYDKSIKENIDIHYNINDSNIINIKFINKFNIIEINKKVKLCLENIGIKYSITYKNNKSIEYNINNGKIIIEKEEDNFNTYKELINSIKIIYYNNLDNMSYYAAPAYAGLTCLLCLSYSCMESVRNNGKTDTATNSILSVWSIVSIIVTSVITGVAGEMMIGMASTTHILIALILACVTLSISSSLIFWAR